MHRFDLTVNGVCESVRIAKTGELGMRRLPFAILAWFFGAYSAGALAQGLPSDILRGENVFLAKKGLDDNSSACQYYSAIGVVQGCRLIGADSQGKPIILMTFPITFKEWKRQAGIGNFLRPGGVQASAVFVNAVDLNFTRKHKSVYYAPNKMAAVVCNYEGPASTAWWDVNTAIFLATMSPGLLPSAQNLSRFKACVAMDFIQPDPARPPFTRFLAFGASGNLLLSVDLDGRGLKGIPGACTTCHNTNLATSKFTDVTKPDIGARFLPYDTGNFLFSTRSSYTEIAQTEAIYKMNQNIRALAPIGTTVATSKLIDGWYQRPWPLNHVLDKGYVPSSWPKTGNDANFYKTVVAPGCRTCHTASLNFDFDNYGTATGSATIIASDVCDKAIDGIVVKPMPDSLVDYNRFFTSGPQLAAMKNFIADHYPPIPNGLNAFNPPKGNRCY